MGYGIWEVMEIWEVIGSCVLLKECCIDQLLRDRKTDGVAYVPLHTTLYKPIKCMYQTVDNQKFITSCVFCSQIRLKLLVLEGDM